MLIDERERGVRRRETVAMHLSINIRRIRGRNQRHVAIHALLRRFGIVERQRALV